MVLDQFLVFLNHHFLALAHGLLTKRHVLLQFPFFAPRLDLKIKPGPQTLSHLSPVSPTATLVVQGGGGGAQALHAQG